MTTRVVRTARQHVSDMRNEHFVMASAYGVSAAMHYTLIATLLVSAAYGLMFVFQMWEVHKTHPHDKFCDA